MKNLFKLMAFVLVAAGSMQILAERSCHQSSCGLKHSEPAKPREHRSCHSGGCPMVKHSKPKEHGCHKGDCSRQDRGLIETAVSPVTRPLAPISEPVVVVAEGTDNFLGDVFVPDRK